MNSLFPRFAPGVRLLQYEVFKLNRSETLGSLEPLFSITMGNSTSLTNCAGKLKTEPFLCALQRSIPKSKRQQRTNALRPVGLGAVS